MSFKANYLALAIVSLAAADASAADLLAIYRLAVENDPVYAEAQAKYDAAQQKIPQARAGLLPNVALSGNRMHNNEDIDRRRPLRDSNWNFNSHTYTLSLTQPLFRWQNWVGYDQSKLVVAQAEAAFSTATQDLVLRTAQAYFDVLAAQTNLRAAQSYRAAVTAQLDIARQAFAIGTGIVTDVHDAEARMEVAVAQTIAMETDLDVKRRALAAIIGSPPPELARGRKDAMLTPPQPAEMAKWIEAAEENNFAVQQYRLAAEIADKEVSRQRAGHYPTLDFVASSGNTSALNSGTREWTDANRVGVQVNIPLFQGGEVVAKTDEAIALRRGALSATETARRSAALQAQQAYLGVVNGLAQVRALQAAEKAAQSAVTSNRDAFKVGMRLSIDVLNAESQAYNTMRDLTRTMLDTLMAQFRLKAAVGTLGEPDVVAVNALLER